MGLFSTSPRQDRHWNTNTFVSSGYQGLFVGVKWRRFEADQSFPSTAEVKIAWSCKSTPPVPRYAFRAWSIFKHRDKFTFPYHRISKSGSS